MTLPNTFQFAAPGQIFFGEGSRNRVGKEATNFGRRAFVCSGSDSSRVTSVVASLNNEGLATLVFPISAEPDLESIQAALKVADRFRPDVVVAVGGGSVIDTAKAIAALLSNKGDPLDYLETVGRGLPLESPALPCIAIPTSAGTGAEATRNAVIGLPEKRIKVSLRHPSMMPRVVIVDPELTWSLTPAPTAYGGMDALTQLIEAWLCTTPNPFTDALCRDGIPRAARSLRPAWRAAGESTDGNPVNDDAKTARSDMALAALESGLALANARLGAVHGIAGPLGGMTGAPHGALCAALLVEVLAQNLKMASVSEKSAPVPGLLARFTELARMLTGNGDAEAPDSIVFLNTLSNDLSIPGLQHWGLSKSEFAALAQAALGANSMKGNPFVLDATSIIGILERSWL